MTRSATRSFRYGSSGSAARASAPCSPAQGAPGGLVTITGSRFDPDRGDNDIRIGGASAFVIQASETELIVLVDEATVTGPVTVQVEAKIATAADPFTILPDPVAGEDGPPILFTGSGGSWQPGEGGRGGAGGGDPAPACENPLATSTRPAPSRCW